MSDIQFRAIGRQDYAPVAAFLNEQWGFPASERNGRVARHFGYAYLFLNLAGATFCRIATVDGAAAGILCLRESGVRAFHPLFSCRMLPHLVPLLARREFAPYLRGWRSYFRYAGEQEKRLPRPYDAQLMLLLVGSPYRGQRLGRRLLEQAEAYLAQKGRSSYFLHTDTECTYSFYDAVGLHRLDSFSPPSAEGYAMFIYGTE